MMKKVLNLLLVAGFSISPVLGVAITLRKEVIHCSDGSLREWPYWCPPRYSFDGPQTGPWGPIK